MCRQRLLLRRHRQMTQLSDDTRCTRRTSSTRHMMRLSPLQHAGERACEYREYRVCETCVCGVWGRPTPRSVRSLAPRLNI